MLPHPFMRANAIPRLALLDALCAAAASLALYLALGQRTVYGDGFTFLIATRDAPYYLPAHPLYLPLATALRRAVEPFGLTQYEAFRLLSQVGGACGVAGSSLALRLLGCSRGETALATAWVAWTPSLAFFATIVEIHAPFFAFAALAWLAAALLVRAPRPWAAALLGLTPALAALVHASGLLLPVPLLAAFAAHRWPSAGERRERQRLAALAAIAIAAHGLGFVAFNLLARALGADTAPTAAAGAAWSFARFSAEVRNFGVAAWREWLWPYLPLSVAWLAGFRGQPTRALAWATLAALVVFVGASAVVLGHWQEHGAYLLPLAPLAASIAVRALPWSLAVAGIAASCLLALIAVGSHDRPERPRDYAAGVRELAGDRDVLLLIGDYADIEACFVELPGVEFFFALDTPALVASGDPALRAQLDGYIQRKRAANAAVYLTRAAEERLRAPQTQAQFPGAAMLHQHLRQQYHWRPVAARGFQGIELAPK